MWWRIRAALQSNQAVANIQRHTVIQLFCKTFAQMDRKLNSDWFDKVKLPALYTCRYNLIMIIKISELMRFPLC